MTIAPRERRYETPAAPTDDFFKFMHAIYSARKRSAKNGRDFELTAAVARQLWERCGGRCELTKIPFDFSPMPGKYVRRPFAPSIDRRDSKLGYTEQNVRVVCVAVNLAMNQWGEHVLYRVAAGLVDNARAEMSRALNGHGFMPIGVKRIFTRKAGTRFKTHVMPVACGKTIHLGIFDTIDEALDARVAWARTHQSSRVLLQVYKHTKDEALKAEADLWTTLSVR